MDASAVNPNTRRPIGQSAGVFCDPLPKVYLAFDAERQIPPGPALEQAMGIVISLRDWRALRRPASAPASRPARRPVRATFFYDLRSPWTYLTAERADRLLPALRWQPVAADALEDGAGADPRDERVRAAVERRASELGLPVAWPDGWCPGGRVAMRMASLADEEGCSAGFVLAATRLAFCGGYDLDDPEILAEAAAAAGLDFDLALRAAGEVWRDLDMERAALRLLRLGASELPTAIVNRVVFSGERRLSEAAAAAMCPLEPRSRRASR